MTTTTDWEELITTSHLDAVKKMRELLEEQEYEEAYDGLKALEDIMSRAERKALSSQLRRLMLHILKWRYQPEKRAMSWVRTIIDARREIRDLQNYMPSLTKNYILTVWKDCLEDAIEGAKAEMNFSRKDKFEPAALTWQEVFEDEYLLYLK